MSEDYELVKKPSEEIDGYMLINYVDIPEDTYKDKAIKYYYKTLNVTKWTYEETKKFLYEIKNDIKDISWKEIYEIISTMDLEMRI